MPGPSPGFLISSIGLSSASSKLLGKLPLLLAAIVSLTWEHRVANVPIMHHGQNAVTCSQQNVSEEWWSKGNKNDKAGVAQRQLTCRMQLR